MRPHPTVELRGAVGRLCDGIEAGRLPPEVLLAGAAGTGKTWGILLVLHLLSLRRAGMRILVGRKTRESLTESALVTYEQEVLPITGHRGLASGCMRRVRQSYRYPNGTEWIVGGLDKPSKILSTSYDLAYINEAIELTETDWETLQSRIGRPDRSHGLNCLLGDTNPGDAANWLKTRCDAGRTALWQSFHRDNPGLHDGRDWTEKGRAYLARLERLTGSRRKRLLEGLWAAGEGAWFDGFDSARHVTALAEYDPRLPTFLAVDPGVHTGAVWFQINRWGIGLAVNVFGDFYGFNQPAFAMASVIVARSRDLCGHRLTEALSDPAGDAMNAVGPTVLEEYERAGLPLSGWPVRGVLDGLALVESLVSIEPPRLLVHPRCTHLIEAFGNYVRKQRQGQWIDRPEDPQHPHEDLMDALRGGLMAELGGVGAWADDPNG
jgi:hypothetical protein